MDNYTKFIISITDGHIIDVEPVGDDPVMFELDEDCHLTFSWIQ